MKGQMNDISSIEKMLLERAKKSNIPANGSLELLPLCNMNCDMCYVRLCREEVQTLGGLHTADEWIKIGKQMKDAGVLFLLLTGGEPLLFPDFKRLYTELHRMGFIITINTNGTLIDDEWIRFFNKNKPRRINITLYGTDEREYEKLCHYPKGFNKTIRAIKLLKNADIDVKISCSITKINQGSLEKMFHIGDELGILVHVSSYMKPVVREREKPFAEQIRTKPEEAARVSIEAMKLQFSKEIFQQYVSQSIERVEDLGFPRGNGHLSCMAGSCSFTVNWQGYMRPCVVLTEPSVSVFEKGFAEAWKEVCSGAEKLVINKQCTTCKYKPICKVCAAATVSETGRYDGIPEYLCRYSKVYYQILKEEAQKDG